MLVGEKGGRTAAALVEGHNTGLGSLFPFIITRTAAHGQPDELDWRCVHQRVLSGLMKGSERQRTSWVFGGRNRKWRRRPVIMSLPAAEEAG